MTNTTNPSLNQISISENINFLNIDKSDFILNIDSNSIFYLTINSNLISTINIDCLINNSLIAKYLNLLLFFYNATNNYIKLKFANNFIWNSYTSEPDFIVLYPKVETSLVLSTFNSGNFWLIDKHSVVYNAYHYYTQPTIEIPIITNPIDSETNIYLLSDFNLRISSFKPINNSDILKYIELNIYSDLELTNRILLKNILPINDIIDLSNLKLKKNTIYYIQLRYVGNKYYSNLSEIFSIKLIDS